ncbi:MAG: hypothetical protein QM756_20530 [Polyangiaceae bacterium]
MPGVSQVVVPSVRTTKHAFPPGIDTPVRPDMDRASSKSQPSAGAHTGTNSELTLLGIESSASGCSVQ